MPVTAMTTDFTATFQASTAILMDDILCYPDVAQVTTYLYDPLRWTKQAATNTNGVVQYFQYDAWSRPTYILDQDKNIILRKKYVTSQSQAFPIYINYVPSENIHPSTSIGFTTSAQPYYNNAGVNYAWNFGDGTPVVNAASTAAVNHAYTSAANYTVTLTITSSYYVTQTLTTTITVVL